MKTILAPLAGSLLLLSQPASAAPAAEPPPHPAPAAALNPESLAVAHQILDTAFPPAKRMQMFGSMIDSLTEQMKSAVPSSQFSNDKDFQALLDRSQARMFAELKAATQDAIPDYFEAMARAYARDFSLDDLDAILAFAKTPTGQHFFERSTQILKDPDVQAASQRMSAKLMAKLPEITRQSMQDVEDYVAKKQKEEQAAKPTPVS
jgi:hypothetical protein